MMFRTRPTIAIALVAALSQSIGLFAAEPVASGTNIIIGLLLPPEEAQSNSIQEGALLAVEHENQNTRVPAHLVIRGRVGQWAADGVEAARMVSDDGALGLIAPPDGAATHLVLQVAGRTAVPVVTLCADSSVSQAGVPWMVRGVPRNIEQAQTIFSSFPDLKWWLAVVPGARAGREISRDLKAAAETSNVSLANCLEVKSPLISVENIRDQILQARPEAVLLWLDPLSAASIAKALRVGGYTGKLAGPASLQSKTFVSAGGNSLEGFLLPTVVLDRESTALSGAFRKSFEQRFGHCPDYAATMSYDAAGFLVRILRQADPSSLARAFPLGLSFPAASGMMSFDSEGNRKITLQPLVAQQGQFVPLVHEKTNVNQ